MHRKKRDKPPANKEAQPIEIARHQGARGQGKLFQQHRTSVGTGIEPVWQNADQTIPFPDQSWHEDKPKTVQIVRQGEVDKATVGPEK